MNDDDAASDKSKSSPINAADCQTMAEVRRGVDATDVDLVQLLARRFAYMDAAARIKQERSEVRDEARKAEVISNASKLSKAAGLPSGFAENLWELLVETSIAYEQDVWDKKAK